MKQILQPIRAIRMILFDENIDHEKFAALKSDSKQIKYFKSIKKKLKTNAPHLPIFKNSTSVEFGSFHVTFSW
jgi:hypothetical protein